MEWIERWNRAMDEIELSLTGEIDCERLGRIACCSAYHFQRMFTYLAGVPLGEYVRRRRMSLAAADLQAGRDKVIDIAARYGVMSIPTLIVFEKGKVVNKMVGAQSKQMIASMLK